MTTNRTMMFICNPGSRWAVSVALVSGLAFPTGAQAQTPALMAPVAPPQQLQKAQAVEKKADIQKIALVFPELAVVEQVGEHRLYQVGDNVTFFVQLTKPVEMNAVVKLSTDDPTLLTLPATVTIPAQPANWERVCGAIGANCANGRAQFTARVAKAAPTTSGASAVSLSVNANLGNTPASAKRVMVSIVATEAPTAAIPACGSQTPRVSIETRALIIAGTPVSITAKLNCLPSSNTAVQIISSNEAVVAGIGTLTITANRQSASYDARTASPQANFENVVLRPFLPMLNPIVQGEAFTMQVRTQ